MCSKSLLLNVVKVVKVVRFVRVFRVVKVVKRNQIVPYENKCVLKTHKLSLKKVKNITNKIPSHLLKKISLYTGICIGR